MISVIIPAHNEARTIGRTLSALRERSAPEELQVIVVCNGCSDNTAQSARSLGVGTQVLETEIASKVHALNLGDTVASGWPRFYVDADVVLPLEMLRKLVAKLEEPRTGERPILAVAPRFRMDLTGCSWCVRAFYDINDRLPTSKEGIGGSGVYGLSKEGRSRFEQFPDITADDGFVRVQFKPEERATLEDCCSTVFAPKTLRELVTIKTRSHFGSMELRQKYPDLWANKGPGNGGTLKKLCLRPWLWPKLAVYGYVKVVARVRARRRLRAGNFTWERAESSRLAVSPALPGDQGPPVPADVGVGTTTH